MPYFLRLIKIALMLISVLIVLYFSNLFLSRQKDWFFEFDSDFLNYFLPGFPRKLEGVVAWLLIISALILIFSAISSVLQ